MGVEMPPSGNDRAVVRRARSLRNASTEGEKRLWSELRQFRRIYGLHVRRQAPIGRYVADFVIQSRRLVIEVDGEFHALPNRQIADARRDEWLKSQGYRTLRITTGELSENLDGCIETILRELGLA